MGASLKELYLRANNIGDAGAAAFAKALEVNTEWRAHGGSVRALYLCANNIGDTGAAAFAKVLAVNASQGRPCGGEVVRRR